jgi:hypothetical protein
MLRLVNPSQCCHEDNFVTPKRKAAELSQGGLR